MTIIYTDKALNVDVHALGRTDIGVHAHDAEGGRASVSLMFDSGSLYAMAQISVASAREVAAMLSQAADAIEADAREVAA